MYIVKAKAPLTGIYASESETAQFAACELQYYIHQMTGCRLPFGCKGGNLIILQIGADGACHDGFRICVKKKRIIISANRERGILYGVYALLEKLGCRWFTPGKEYVPQKDALCLEEGDIIASPDFETRILMEESGYDWLRNGREPDAWMEEAVEMIDWAAKNRINTFDVLLHEMILNKIPHLDKIARELKKRGMMLATGGHLVQGFVDKKLYETKPYFFIEKDGTRKPNGNLCCASEEVHELILDKCKEILRRLPDISIFHTWFADVASGDWCECVHCKSLTPVKQQFHIINRLASGLAGEFPNLKIDMLFYHDTLEAQELPEPASPNLLGMYAARERCYTHNVNESDCGRNSGKYSNLTKLAKQFDTLIFEYYTDMILFNKMSICTPWQITSDLRAYRSLGVGRVSCLTFLRYTNWAYPVNLYTFARASWDTNYRFADDCKSFCAYLYPGHGHIMENVFTQQERASAMFLTFCAYVDDCCDLRMIPNQPRDFHEGHIRRIQESAALLSSCLSQMECDGMIIEKEILKITILELQATCASMTGDCDTAIEKKIEILEIINRVPQNAKGISGFWPFTVHLCKEQIDWLKGK